MRPTLRDTLLPENILSPYAFENPWDKTSLTEAAALCFLASIITQAIILCALEATDSTTDYVLVIPGACLAAICSYRNCLCTRSRLSNQIETIKNAPASNRSSLLADLSQNIKDNTHMRSVAEDIAKGSPGIEWFVEFTLLGSSISSAISTLNPWVIIPMLALAALDVCSLQKPAKKGLALRETFIELISEASEPPALNNTV